MTGIVIHDPVSWQIILFIYLFLFFIYLFFIFIFLIFYSFISHVFPILNLLNQIISSAYKSKSEIEMLWYCVQNCLPNLQCI